MSVNKQWLHSSLFNYVGLLLGYVNMVILFPAQLQADEFGFLRIVMSSSLILAKFGEFGFSGTVIRFFSFYRRSPVSIKRFFSLVNYSLVLILAVFSVIFLIVRFFLDDLFGKDLNPELLVSDYALDIYVISISSIFSEIYFAYLRARGKITFPVFLQEMGLRFFQLLPLIIYMFDLISFRTFVGAFAMAYSAIALFTFSYLFYCNFWGQQLAGKLFEKAGHWKEMVRYSFYMLLAKFPNHVINQVDIAMLGMLATFESAGGYAIVVMLSNIIKVPAKNLISILQPKVSNLFQEGNLTKLSELYVQNAFQLFLPGGMIFLLLLFNVEFLEHLFRDKYEDITLILFFLGLSKVFNLASGLNGVIINNSKYYRATFLFNSALLIVTVVLNYIFIPLWESVGAAFATAISIAVLNVLKISLVYRKLGFFPYTTKHLKLLAIFSLLSPIYLFTGITESVFINLALKNLTLVFVAPLLLVMFKLFTFKEILSSGTSIFKR